MNENLLKIKQKFPEILCSIVLLTLFTTPQFSIGFCFKIHFSDLLLPFIIISLFRKGFFSCFTKKIVIISVIVSLYITFTIIINKTWNSYNNFYEIYHTLKLVFLLLFFRQYYAHQKHAKYIDIAFGIIVIINLLHFFNIFNFNEIVMPVYAGEGNRNLLFFGYYFIEGTPGPKRMIGTLGNPNYNALLFIFFIIWYAIKNNQSVRHKIFYYIAFCLLLFCQSRTTLICFLFVYFANIFLSKVEYKKILLQSGIVLILFFGIMKSGVLVNTVSNDSLKTADKSLNYINADIDNYLEATSFTARLNNWKIILQKVKEKQIFGHSPDKQNYYNSSVMKKTDNEYILMLYRYGIIGLLAYLSLFLYPGLKAFRYRYHIEARNVILLFIAFGISAFMNEPLTNHTICNIYIFIVAIFFQFIDRQPKTIL